LFISLNAERLERGELNGCAVPERDVIINDWNNEEVIDIYVICNARKYSDLCISRPVYRAWQQFPRTNVYFVTDDIRSMRNDLNTPYRIIILKFLFVSYY